MLRKAKTGDVKTIHRMIMQSAREGQILPRSLGDIYNCLRDFYVYIDEGNGSIAGVCAMHIVWEDLAEIRSLFVDENYRGRRIGRTLVEACISEAITLGLYKIFSLTYKKGFFEALGFHETDRKTLPEKIWADCFKCAKYPDYCDEASVIIEL